MLKKASPRLWFDTDKIACVEFDSAPNGDTIVSLIGGQNVILRRQTDAKAIDGLQQLLDYQ